MNLVIGKNIMNGKVVTVEVTERGTVKATTEYLRGDDITQPLTIEVTTLELLTVAVRAILNQ